MSATRVATVRGDVPSDRPQAKTGLSVTTLMIASASSLAAALVVSKIWGGGTLIGAAMTPVIVALVSEGLRRPATVITSVRETRSARFDPVAEGRAGLREGDLEAARSPVPAAAAAERRVHRASGRAGGGGLNLRMPRPRVIAAVATGLVAFLLAGVFLTGSELVLGKSVVSSSKRTTYIPVHRSTSSSKTDTKDKTDTTTTQDTTTTPTTSTPTTTEPPATATTPTAPPTQTAPPPTTTTPPPTQAPGTPTTPAPQSAAPPASTTP
jgi:hypothetical protein